MMFAQFSLHDIIRCLRDAELDVVHGDDRVHKRNGVDGKIYPDLLSEKDVRTVERVTSE